MPPRTSGVSWSWLAVASVTALAIVVFAWVQAVHAKVESHETSVITLTLIAKEQQKTNAGILASLKSIENSLRGLQDDRIRDQSGH